MPAPNQGDHDDNQSRPDRHCDCLDELVVVQPGMTLHHSTVKKWHNGESAAEYEQSYLGKIDEDFQPGARYARRSPGTSVFWVGLSLISAAPESPGNRPDSGCTNFSASFIPL
jgi:hypothetical protein